MLCGRLLFVREGVQQRRTDERRQPLAMGPFKVDVARHAQPSDVHRRDAGWISFCGERAGTEELGAG